MDTEEFIEEVANRLTAYIASADDVKRVNPNTSPAGLRAELDLRLPSKGSGWIRYWTTWTVTSPTA